MSDGTNDAHPRWNLESFELYARDAVGSVELRCLSHHVGMSLDAEIESLWLARPCFHGTPVPSHSLRDHDPSAPGGGVDAWTSVGWQPIIYLDESDRRERLRLACEIVFQLVLLTEKPPQHG